MRVTPYDEDYYLRGKQTGKSLYENYRWLPDLTIPMVCAMVAHLGIKPHESVLDFGCARGYTVRAFRELDYNATGVDISKWAIDNCDQNVKDCVFILDGSDYEGCLVADWIIAKDVLEHIAELDGTIHRIMSSAAKGVFVVVPLSHNERNYDVPSYELDVTHIWRQSLHWWMGKFCRRGWTVTGQYRVNGIKDNYAHFPTGNGFITARRLNG
jgi:trans-aconitate methyltransferase